MRFAVAVLLVLGGSSLSYSPADAADIGLKEIEARGGYANGEDDIGGTFLLGVNADLGQVAPSLSLEAGADFWTKSYDMGLFGSEAEWRYTNVGILAGLRYDFPIEGAVSPFVFAGLGLHVARSSGEMSYMDLTGQTVTEDDSETEMELGAYFGGGTEIEIKPNLNFVGRVGFDVNGGADYFFVTGGVAFPIGQ